MYPVFTIIFLLATFITRGDNVLAYAIAAGLFGIADSICYFANKFNK